MYSALPSFVEWRLRRKKGRLKPVPELTCKCGAYRFPHRFGNGACNGWGLAEYWWENRACGDCGSITYDSETFVSYCKVVEGCENLEECEMLQEFIQRNEIHIKGVNWK
jgi:hypothetical protein